MTIARIPCTSPVLVLTPQTTLAEALRQMLENGVNHLPVCDSDGRFVGVVGTGSILRELIPVSARTSRGLDNLKFAGDATRLLSAHLLDLEKRTVGEAAKTTLPVLEADCPVLEAALLLSQHSSPLPIVDAGGKLLALLSRRALLEYLVRDRDADHAR